MNREEDIELIRNSAVSEHTEALVNYLLPSARIIVQDEALSGSHPSIASHFGGLPSLPRNVAWPKWDKSEYLKAQIARLEKRLESFIRRTQDQPETIPGIRERQMAGFRDNIERLRKEQSIGRVPLGFLGQLSLREIYAICPIKGWPQ